MSPARLALRSLLRGSTRSLLAVVLITASLCVLDLYAGHVASERAHMEYEAVIGERLGHLAIVRAPAPGAAPTERMFTPDEAERVIRLAESNAGVALVVPQMRVDGVASTGQRSALFQGQGIVLTAEQSDTTRQLPGKLNSAAPNGIAVGSRDAKSLGLSTGSTLTLTGATLDARARTIEAQVVDIYSGVTARARQPILLPFALSQSLLDTERTERIVVYLSDPQHAEERRLSLAASLRAAGIPAQIKSWQEQSAVYASERSVTDIAFDSVAGMVFAVIAATVAATMSMNALERRREVGTLRVLGMRSSGVFVMFVMEGLWMALAGVALSLVGSGSIAWVINRAALSYAVSPGIGNAPMLVELDFYRMGMAVLTVLAVALLASLVPAFKAARAAIAPALAA
ncbi:ABC transporter permease [Massilia sp. CF038]|uniref:ABC transporter permease n=1 Tax=Massilia sp. CF038 TaxID=1881045 RepID=UPI000911876E|nr:FtsX-like permease family protein [Massilia sp. CF038]SHH44976.1 ABC-type transport system, involved in lipoprotein release, permease component [Massilia sp. CF038]